MNTAIKKEAEALKQLEKAKLLSSRKSMLIDHGWDILVGDESMFLEEETGNVTISDETIFSMNQEGLDKLAQQGDEEVARRMMAIRIAEQKAEEERLEAERIYQEGMWKLNKLLNKNTVIIVTGCHLFCELLDRPVAEYLKKEIDLCGDYKFGKRAIIMGDRQFLADTDESRNNQITE